MRPPTSTVFPHSICSTVPYSNPATRFHSSPNNPRPRKPTMTISSNAWTPLPPNSPASARPSSLSDAWANRDMDFQGVTQSRVRVDLHRANDHGPCARTHVDEHASTNHACPPMNMHAQG